jgi:hypothetical protein
VRLGEKVRQRHVSVNRKAAFGRHLLRFDRRNMAAPPAADFDCVSAKISDGRGHGQASVHLDLTGCRDENKMRTEIMRSFFCAASPPYGGSMVALAPGTFVPEEQNGRRDHLLAIRPVQVAPRLRTASTAPRSRDRLNRMCDVKVREVEPAIGHLIDLV